MLSFTVLIRVIKIIFLLVMVGVFFLLWRYLAEKMEEKNWEEDTEEIERETPKIVKELIILASVSFGILLWLLALWFDLGVLLLGLSFGIGYACKNAIRNIISGILIMTNKEFKLGDVISFRYSKTHSYFGRIEEVTLRYAILRRLNRKRVIIPNYLLTSFPIVTYGSEEIVRLETTVTIPFSEWAKDCIAKIRHAINALEFTEEKESTTVTVQSMHEQWINYLIYFYIDPNAGKMRRRAISEINIAIAKAFKEAWITFAYPHTVITVEPLTEQSKKMWEVVGENMRG